MDWLTESLIGFLSEKNHPLGLGILAGAAAIEYLFPPFPGDTITVAGAALITGYGWSFAAVFTAVLVGSAAGSMVDYYFGVRLQRWRARRPAATQRAAVTRLINRFRRYGAVYLLLNRFLPGIRALFFVAAGMAGMRALPVLFYSVISAALWNLGLIAVGSLVGANLDALLLWTKRYSAIVWFALALLVLWLVLRHLAGRRRSA